MIKVCSIIVTLFLVVSNSAFSQNRLLDNSDTLSKKETALLQEAERHSFIGYIHITDSFSNKKDKINTRKWLQKVSPYYLMFNDVTDKNVDSTFRHVFSLSDTDRDKYEAVFTHAYQNRSNTYRTFEHMAQEDQQVRHVLDHTLDSFTYEAYEKRMRITDSTHFAYLYSYIKDNGWPTLENGSLYAELLAIDDHQHHSYYIPQLKRAVFEHNAILSGLQLMIQWNKSSEGLASILKQIDTSKKMIFTLPSLLRCELPGTKKIYAIEKVIKKHCPVKIIVAYKCGNDKIFSLWGNKIHKTGHGHKHPDVLAQLMNDLHPYCPKRIPKDIWDVWNFPSEENKVVLYVLYK